MNLKKRILLFSCFVMTMSCCSVFAEIVDVAIFLEVYEQGRSVERKNFQELNDFGSTASNFIAALVQGVDVVVASPPLILILKGFVDNGAAVYDGKIRDLEIEMQEARNDISEFRNWINQDPTATDVPQIQEAIKAYEELQREHLKAIERIRKAKLLIDGRAHERYSIYKIDHEFGVFVRRQNTREEDLRNCGLNSNLANQEVNFGDIETEFGRVRSGDINTNSLESIFDRRIVRRRSIPRKIIYLDGHGGFEEYVAQLTMNQYVDFINRFLPAINCKFLFVNSCYGYGLKTETIFERLANFQGKIYEEAEIAFPIAVGAISDSASKAYSDIDLRGFFDGLHDLFVTRKEEKSETWISRRPFEDISRDVAGPFLENTVLIRFPGLRQSFKPVNVDDNFLIITYSYLLAHELESVRGLRVARERSVTGGPQEERALTPRTPEELERLERAKTRALQKERQFRAEMKKVSKELKEKLKLEGRSSQERRHLESLLTQKIKRELKERALDIPEKKLELKEARAQGRPLPIALVKLPIRVENKTAILLYPTILISTLKIVGTDIPALVSMFPGHAHHFIKKIEASNISFNDLIKGFFSKLRIKSKKLFLIGEIICQDKTITDVVIETRYDGDNNQVAIEVKFTENNDQKQVTYNADTFGPEALHAYTVDDVLNQLSSISIFKEAYMEATGGIESKRTFLNALKNYFSLFQRRVPMGEIARERRERELEHFKGLIGRQTELANIRRSLPRIQRGPERVTGTIARLPQSDQVIVKDKQGQDIVCLLPKKTGRRLVSRIYKGAKVGYIEVAPGKRYVVKLYKRDFPKYKSRRVKYGTVQEVKIDDKFTVEVDGKEIRCHVHRGKVSKKEINSLEIDIDSRVEIEIFPGDPTRGRIVEVL